MNEVSVNLRCVLLRNGIEIWLEEGRAQNLEQLMERQKYIRLDESVVNVSEIAGIFTPAHMEDYKRIKAGQWKCQRSEWHDRGQKCNCAQFRVVIRSGKKIQEEFIPGMGWITK